MQISKLIFLQILNRQCIRYFIGKTIKFFYFVSPDFFRTSDYQFPLIDIIYFKKARIKQRRMRMTHCIILLIYKRQSIMHPSYKNKSNSHDRINLNNIQNSNNSSQQRLKLKLFSKNAECNHKLPIVKKKQALKNYKGPHQSLVTNENSTAQTKTLIENQTQKITTSLQRIEFKGKQKTMPIELITTAATSSFVKEIIKRSKSKNQVGKITDNKINPYHQCNQKSQMKSDKCIINSLKTNISSLKEIHLFRITSKKYLRDSSQKKGQSQQHKNNSLKQLINPTLSLHKEYKTIQVKENNQNLINHLKSEPHVDISEISQIRELTMVEQCSEESSINIPQLDCSIIIKKQETKNESSFLSQNQKNMVQKMGKSVNFNKAEKNKESFEVGSKIMGIAPGLLKKMMDQKNRKKIIQVEKLRKKFPQDFFKA